MAPLSWWLLLATLWLTCLPHAHATVQKERTPMQKRGPKAWINAHTFDQLEQARCSRPLRLIVHHVNDATNDGYTREVEAFLLHVHRLRLPFHSNEDKDHTLAS